MKSPNHKIINTFYQIIELINAYSIDFRMEGNLKVPTIYLYYYLETKYF